MTSTSEVAHPQVIAGSSAKVDNGNNGGIAANNNNENHTNGNAGHSGNGGITQAIRNHLGFNDDRKWKEFSTRRLELIDKFNLSYKKASEQDDSIKQIANLLRTEFGFPLDTLMDFDKLVRAAIQSVRRNRKRSSRSRLNNDRFILNEKLLEQQSFNNQQQSIHNKMGVNSLLSTSTTTNTTPSTSHPTSPTPSLPLPTAQSITPLQLPPIKSTSSTSTTSTISISKYNKTKLLQSIEKSKTCASISNNDPDLHLTNLTNLGNSIISASASFVLERFFQDLSTESINYLYQQITSIPIVSKILKSLGVITTELLILSDYQSSQLFAKLLGGVIKDFGFDSISYDLAEIFHEIILNQYPLMATQVNKITTESLLTPTLSVVPKEADKEWQKNVRLRYGDRVLNFIYKPISTAPPNVMEIIENGKIAFGIHKENNLIRLKIVNEMGRTEDLIDDEQLIRLFKRQGDLDLEIYVIGGGGKLLGINSLL